jgi:TRAP-type uncharacterized transport system fused permease subunit
MNANNTIENYEPNNELFKYIVLSALCFISALYYAMLKSFTSNHFAWYDWVTLGAAAGIAAYFFLKTYRYRQIHKADY